MHDFASFTDKSIGEKSTRVLVEAAETVESGQLILFRIRASHFLWKMVRRIVGTLVEVGRGSLPPSQMKEFLEGPSDAPARWTAPPSGLFLEQVLYPGDKWRKELRPLTPIPN